MADPFRGDAFHPEHAPTAVTGLRLIEIACGHSYLIQQRNDKQ
jgi:hypothetical protein